MAEIIALILLILACSGAVFFGVLLAATLAIEAKERNKTDDWD